jgi:small GTP-binding protein
MIGFPSVGKSTMLNVLTNTESKAAGYEFTTLTCIPGFIQYNDAKIQLLDLPGIIEGAASGKGRGKQVIAVGKSADLIMMVLDTQKGEEQKAKLTRELESVGLRLNQEKPHIALKITTKGGVMVNCTQKRTKMDDKMIKSILAEYKIHNAHLNLRGDYDVDQLIDAIEGNRKYVKCLYVYNKIDTVAIEDIEILAQKPNTTVLSSGMLLGIPLLLEKLWEMLGLVRIYTKKKGCPPDLGDPLILTKGRGGYSVRLAIHQIHRSIINSFKCAYVWGKSTKHDPQRVGLDHELCDEDVMQIMKT